MADFFGPKRHVRTPGGRISSFLSYDTSRCPIIVIGRGPLPQASVAESSVVLPPVRGAISCHSASPFKAKRLIPTQSEIMSAAYEGACKALGLVDRSDPLTQLVAKKIIALATDGQRDPERIRAEALKAPAISAC